MTAPLPHCRGAGDPVVGEGLRGCAAGGGGVVGPSPVTLRVTNPHLAGRTQGRPGRLRPASVSGVRLTAAHHI